MSRLNPEQLRRYVASRAIDESPDRAWIGAGGSSDTAHFANDLEQDPEVLHAIIRALLKKTGSMGSYRYKEQRAADHAAAELRFNSHRPASVYETMSFESFLEEVFGDALPRFREHTVESCKLKFDNFGRFTPKEVIAAMSSGT